MKILIIKLKNKLHKFNKKQKILIINLKKKK